MTMADDPKSRQSKKDTSYCCPGEDAQLTSDDDSFLDEEEEDEDSGCPTCLI